MSGIFNKLELDVVQVNELSEGIELAIKYSFPAVVVHPDLMARAIQLRGQRRGRFRLITPVNWPKGELGGIDKFRGLSRDALDTDGFEIMISANNQSGNVGKEVLALTQFIRYHIGALMEVRFVLGTSIRDEETVLNICHGLRSAPTPSMIRTDHQPKLQVSKANTEIHNSLLEKIATIIKAPMKVCGNITNVRCITGCEGASRFAVSLSQATAIIKEFNQQPEALGSILNSGLGTLNQARTNGDVTKV